MASSKSTVNMSTVMRDISDALSLDRSDKKEEAYRKYLECVLRISTKLLKDLHSEGGHVTFNKDVTRFVKLGQQCMDRVASIAAEQADKGPGSPQVPSTTRVATPGLWMSVHAPPSAGIVTSPTNTHTTKAVDSKSSTKKMTPMEMAVMHNQQLLSAFKARQGKNKSLSASQNLALTVQRKMAENLAIAKAREEALAKKMRERQKRLEEQAARRFHTPVGMSEDEQHQRQIYTKILEFEQEEIWMLDLRRQLEASPDDVIVIYNLIERVLSCEIHPLTQQLKMYQNKTLQKIYPLVKDKTDQVNLVRVPLPEHLLAVLTKFQKDQINATTKIVTKKASVDKIQENVNHVSGKEADDNLGQDVANNNYLNAEAKIDPDDFDQKINVDAFKDQSDKDKQENDSEQNITKAICDKEMIECVNEEEEAHTQLIDSAKANADENMNETCDKKDGDMDQSEMKFTSSSKESLKNSDDINDVQSSKSINNESKNKMSDGVSQEDQCNMKNTGSEQESYENNGINNSLSNETFSGKDDEETVMLQNNNTETAPKTESKDETQSPTQEIDDNCKSDEDENDAASTSQKNFSDVTENVKHELKTAILKGQHLQNKLEKENKFLKSRARVISFEVEKYNEENMDDLFDDDGEEDDDNDSAFGSSFYSTISGTWSSSGKSEDHHEKQNKALDMANVGAKTSDNQSDVGIQLEADENDTGLAEKTFTKLESDSDGVNAKDENASKRDSLTRNLSFQNLESAIKQLRNEAYHRHLKHITEDILTSIEKIQVLFVIGFEQLGTAEGRDQCNLLVEKHFFKPIWKYLLMLFRLANEPKEIAISNMMTLKLAREPEEFSVRQKLCLSSSNASNDGDYPYKAAVDELCSVFEKSTMLEKLDCLVKTSRLVLLCVDQYYEQEDQDISEKPSIGADDLLPVLCYVVARCKLPEIVSECQAMERFVHEGYMFGEEGYCLTSFQTAINYLISEGMKAAACDSD